MNFLSSTLTEKIQLCYLYCMFVMIGSVIYL